jgi:autotransporter-associated beta strand protein
LEERLAPAVKVWSGGALIDPNWSNPANWVGNKAPGAGDDLVFPGGARQAATSTNDFTAGRLFNSITLDASGYSFAGNAIDLGAGGLAVNSAAGGTDSINFGITLGAGASVVNTYAGTTLHLSSVDTSAGFALTFDGSGLTTVVGGVSDTGSVVKNGSGTVLLNTSSYTGTTTLDAGIVQLAVGATLASSSIAVNAGATLQLLNGSGLSQPVTLSGGGDGGGVPGSTVGALEVSGTSTISSPLTLAADATLGVDAGGALTATGAIYTLGGNTFTINSAGSAVFFTAFDGTAGPGSLVINSALTTGTVTLNGGCGYTGPTTVAAGTLDLTGAALMTSTSYTIDQGATLLLDNSGLAVSSRLPVNAAINLNGGTLTLAGNAANDVNQTVGNITLVGGHSNIRVNPASASFLTQLTAAQLGRGVGATVNFSSTGVLGSTKDQVVFTKPFAPSPSGILPFATVNDTDFATTGATGVAAFAGYKTSLAGAGPNDVVKLAANATLAANETIGGLVLSGATLTINAGITLTLSSGGLLLRGATIKPASGLATVNLGAGEGFIFSNASATANTITAHLTAGGAVDLSGPASAVTGLTLNPGTFGNSFNGTYLDSTNLSILGTNPLGLTSGALTLTGGTLTTGTANVTLPNPVSLTNAVTALNAPNLTLSGPVTLTGANALTVSQTATLTGAIGGSGSLVQLGNGTLTVNPFTANTYTGGTVLAGGTLALGGTTPLGLGPLTLAAGTLTNGAAGGITLANPLVLDNATFGGTNAFTFTGPVGLTGQNVVQVIEPTTLSGPIGGTGGLTVSGTGKLTLSGNSSYSGATMVTGGSSLVVNGAQPNSAVGVASGTLSGSGQTGFIAAAPAGQVIPGTPGGPNGTLSAAGANFSEGGGLTLQVSGYATAGTDYGRLNLGGGPLVVGGDAVNAPSVLTLDLSNLAAPGEAAGAVVYGSVLGSPALFNEVKIVHNPTDFAASSAYAAAGLNVFLTPGVTATPPVPATTSVWTGADIGRTNWSDALNWVGNIAPVPGNDLIFPAGAAQFISTNDLTGVTGFNSITFEAGGYTVNGNEIRLSGGPAAGLRTTEPAGSGLTATTLNLPIALAVGPDVPFVSTYAGTTLVINGTISVDGASFVSDGAGATTINGQVTGAQGLIKDGSGTLTLSPATPSNYTRSTALNAGLTVITATSSLGAATAPVTVNGGATLQVLGAITVPQALTLSGFGVGGAVPGSLAGALEVNDSATLTGGVSLVGDTWIDTWTDNTGGGVPPVSVQFTTKPIALDGATLTLNAVGPTIIAVPMIDGAGFSAGSLVVNGGLTTGALSLTAASTFTGSATVVAGTLALSGNGSLATLDVEIDANVGPDGTSANQYPPSAPLSSPGAVGDVVLDNRTLNSSTRLPANVTLNFNGGEFTFLGAINAATKESVGSVHVVRGQSYLRMVPGGDSTTKASLILTANSLDREVGATIDFSGTKLGRLNYDQIFFTTPPDPTKTDNIIPFATASASAVAGIPFPSFASYDNAKTNPLGVFAFTGYQTNFDAAATTDIVSVTGTVLVTKNTTIGGLLMDGGTVEVDPGVTLTVTYAILSPIGGGGSIVPTMPGTTASLSYGVSPGNDGIVMTYAPMTIGTAITGIAGVTYGGPSILTLSPPTTGSTYTGITTLDSGTLLLGTNNSPFGDPSGLITINGGTLEASVFTPEPIDIPNPVLFQNAGVNFVPQASLAVNFNGPAALWRNNTLAIPQNVTVTFNGQVSDSTLAASFPASLTDTTSAFSPGGGTLVLNNASDNYTGGTTLVNRGIFAPTLVIGSATALGTGALTLAGGTFQASAPVTIANPLVLPSANVTLGGPAPDNGALTFGGQVTLVGASQLVTTAVPTVFSAPVTGSGSWADVGGTTLNGPISATGVLAPAGGTLEVDAVPSTPAGGIAAGLSGYWPLDGNGNDLSGSGNNFTLAGAPGFGPGKFGQALSLHDNGAQFATRPGDDAAYDFGAADFTLQVWVNFNTTGREQTLLEKFQGATGPGWTLTTASGGTDWQFYAGPAGIADSGPMTISPGVWYDVVARRNGGLFDMFVNDQLVATTPATGAIPATTMPLLLGRRNALDGRDFAVDGRLDDVAIWNRALTDAEIAKLFGGAQGTTPVAVVQSNLDGTGAVALVSAGSSGVVQPGTPAAIGTLSAAGANFANNGTLRLRVSGYVTPGKDYDQLNLGSNPLVLGGTSRLVLDLGGLTAASGPGTVAGAIVYGSRVGITPVFSEVDIINNPFNYAVELDYTAAGLNIVVAIGATDTPALTVPVAQTLLEDFSLTFSPGGGNALAVADPSAINPLEVTLSVGHGTLTLGGTAGLTSLVGNGTASVSFKGSPASVTAALNGLIYAPGNDYTGPDLLTLSASNPGGFGLLGGPQTATVTVAITVTPTGDSPTFVAGLDQMNLDTDGPQTFATWATSVLGEPPNTANLAGLVFTVTNDNPSLFTAGGQPQVALVGTTGPGTGTLTYTPNPTADGVAHVRVTLSNGSPDGDGDTDSFSRSFTITVINPAAPAVNDVIIHWGKQSASLLSILKLYPTRKDLPFQNINAIDLVFNEDVRIPGGTGLSVTGVAALDGLAGGAYGLSAPIFLPGHTVEWRLSTPLGGINGIDELALGLGASTVQSKGNGKFLSSYSQAFNVLVGDVNGDGVVDVNDQLAIVRSLSIRYSGINFLDVDGDGTVSMLDYNIVRAHNGRRLP